MHREETASILTFRDVEESMRTFSGDDEVNVNRWIHDFEEISDMCGWSDIQSVVYAKRLLRGSAKLFVSFESCSRSWRQLKKALKNEFSPRVNSRQVHKELSSRKKKPNESYQEYVYKMLEIASQADVDIQSTLQYIIDGIPDDENNKTVLYGAKTVKELRSKLMIYESMKSNMTVTSKSKAVPEKKKHQIAPADNRFCFNCGAKDHLGAACPNKNKGKKCFKCGCFGHIAARCTDKKEVLECNGKDAALPRPTKEVKLFDQNIIALIDSGSDISIMRADQYIKIGAPKLNSHCINFRGVGDKSYSTLGCLTTDAIVDNFAYQLTVHVVSDVYAPHNLILGADFLAQVKINLSGGRVETVQKLEAADTSVPIFLEGKEETFHLFNIAIDHNLLDVGSGRYLEAIENIIGNYDPRCVKETSVKTKLILTDETPVYQRPRRLSIPEKEEVDRQIEEWLRDGIIRPSSSDFASPIVLVKKKNGDVRICVDYRELNKKILKDRYPLPIIEDQIDKLRNAQVFTTLDLKSGFFHVPVDEASVKYTSFVTPSGQFEFLKTPFGLCNSPAIFQRFINSVFKDLIQNEIVLTYMDDLIIPARSEEEGLQRLQQVLTRAGEYGLEINWRKCQFLKRHVEYLGHEIQNNTVRPSSHKVAAVMKFPRPTTVKQVQSYLGLTGYFRKFIKDYSILAKPLSDLLKDGTKFIFGIEEETAFIQLKQRLCEKPVLKIFNLSAETELHTDASIDGYGAILLQRDDVDGKMHPVYFMSRKTSDAERKYHSYELEVLAIVEALKKFRVYLLGIPFKIVTDCSAIAMTMKKKDLATRVARWALLLEEFNYTVEHRSGKSMKHVDALSRHPLPSVMLVEECHDGLIARLKKAQREDEDLARFLDCPDDHSAKGYVIKHGILYRELNDELLLVVPKAMQIDIIKTAHGQGHFATGKTEAILKREYWFKGMRPMIENVIRNCVHCILAERKRGKQEGLLNPIDKGDVPLDTYHVDHLGPLPSTKKQYRYIFAVIDAFTKYVWLYPTKSTTGEEAVDRLKKQSVVFGTPRRIISDRGSAFTSHVFEDYCKEENIEYARITTGVPRGNGQIERLNRTLIPILTKLAAPKHEEWYKYVDAAQQYLNATPNRSTRYSPFEVLIGKRMKFKDVTEIREMIEQENIEIYQENRDAIRVEAKANIGKIQAENRKTYNKNHKEATKYQEGDLVAVKRTQFGTGLKLCPKYLGPYKIVKVLRNDRYMVEKIGQHEGPRKTSASADHIKPWVRGEEVLEPATSEADVLQDGRAVGAKMAAPLEPSERSGKKVATPAVQCA